MVKRVKQLEWLFNGHGGGTFDVVAVDDGCPDNSGELAKAVIDKGQLQHVTLMDVRDAVKNVDKLFLELQESQILSCTPIATSQQIWFLVASCPMAFLEVVAASVVVFAKALQELSW